jgi:hypothetical protein
MEKFTEYLKANRPKPIRHNIVIAIAESQIVQSRLFVPFSRFHEAMEKCLKRPIFTHEFELSYDSLKDELFNGKKPPTMQEIIELIPEDKRIIIIGSPK